MILDSHMEAANAMSPEAKLAFIDAIVAYTAGGAEPESLPPQAAPAWIIARKDIDNIREESKRKAEAGRRGGTAKARKSKQNRSRDVADSSSAIAVLDSATEKNVAEPSRALAEPWQNPSRTWLNEKENEKEKEKCEDHTARALPEAVYFDPPSAEDVGAYAKANCLPPFDARSFVDYYEAQGWVMGNGQPMMDWKAAARKWGSGQWRFRADEQRRKEAQDADYDRFECVWEDQQQDQG